MIILGLKVHGHDTSAALLSDDGGTLRIVAIAESRLNRRKHSYAYPLLSIKYCLDELGLKTLTDVDHVFIDRHNGSIPGEDSQWGLAQAAKAARLPRGDDDAYLSYLVEQSIRMPQGRVHYVDHIDAHAASTFYVSGFDEAAVLTLEGGIGIYRGAGVSLIPIDRAGYGSAGYRDGSLVSTASSSVNTSHFYEAVTNRLGFTAFDAGKTMGLASYGHTVRRIDYLRLPKVRFDGSTGRHGRYVAKVLSLIPQRRSGEDPLSETWINLAREAEQYLEEDMLYLARLTHEKVGGSNLCLAGGVALSCITNRRIHDETPYKNLFIQPAASDEGIALGCALWGYYNVAKGKARTSMTNAYFGRSASPDRLADMLTARGLQFCRCDNRTLAGLIADGKIVGRCVGRSEFGPRALGNRSILADPREPKMMEIVNKRIKHREVFRPFAPSCHDDKRELYFDLPMSSPFMIMTGDALPAMRERIPAVVHIDNSCRVQTVTREQNADYYDLIEEFGRITGVYVLLNTSFNDNGEAIVETYEDALLSFLRTGLDYLYVDGFLVSRPLEPNAIRTQLERESRETVSKRYDQLLADLCDQNRYRAVRAKVEEWMPKRSSPAGALISVRRQLGRLVRLGLDPLRWGRLLFLRAVAPIATSGEGTGSL